MTTNKKRLMSETVYYQLRNDIIRGKLKPGERLVELDLAKQFQTSQVPVREALLRLDEQGLLRNIKHTGTFVSDISIEEMKELADHRILLERNAIKYGIYAMREEDKHNLTNIYNEMVECAERKDLYALIEADMMFHQSIISLSNRKISSQIWNLIHGQIYRFLMVVHPRYFSDLMEFAETHKPILDTIIAEDVAAAQQACEEHIQLIWSKIAVMSKEQEV